MAADGEFDQRLPDLVFEGACIFDDGSIQVEGNTLDGKRTWILIHAIPIRVFPATKEPE